MSRSREIMAKQRIPQRNQDCRKARKAMAEARKERRETKARNEAAKERREFATARKAEVRKESDWINELSEEWA